MLAAMGPGSNILGALELMFYNGGLDPNFTNPYYDSATTVATTGAILLTTSLLM